MSIFFLGSNFLNWKYNWNSIIYYTKSIVPFLNNCKIIVKMHGIVYKGRVSQKLQNFVERKLKI